MSIDDPSNDWVHELIAMTRPGVDMVLPFERMSNLDYYRVNIPDDSVNEALREAAEAHGRSVEEEISQIVMANTKRRPFPKQYPPGCEPLPGEGFVAHIQRISAPGFEIELPARGLFELKNPYDDAG